MNWACPHCFTELYVSDDRLTATWSFARCYLCAGLSLVKRGELNLLKIDRAPKSEPLIAADANAGHPKSSSVSAPIVPPIEATVQTTETIINAAAISGAMTTFTRSAEQIRTPTFLPNYLDDASLIHTKESRTPAWIALLGIVLLGSGYWAYQSGSKQIASPHRKSRIEVASHLTQAPAAPTEWVDRLQSRAMAPERPTADAALTPPDPTEVPVAPPQLKINRRPAIFPVQRY